MSIDFDVRTIPHDKQRYPTAGDYTTDSYGVVHFRISALPDWRYELLVAIHELVEKFLTLEAGISESEIDDFDMIYEATKPKGSTSEPGDDPDAPYYQQHQIATNIEKYIASKLGVKWESYEEAVNHL